MAGNGCPVNHEAIAKEEKERERGKVIVAAVSEHDERRYKYQEQPRSPGQLFPLSQERQSSSIPMVKSDGDLGKNAGTCQMASNAAAAAADGAGGGSKVVEEEEQKKWQYPSPQMFYNAMRRKGYEADEREMTTVVGIHNAVNERAWSEVLRWENTFHPDCHSVKLAKFQGKPTELSARAKFHSTFTGAAPFDRHDWTIDRCGTHVRYIIDFYTGSKSAIKELKDKHNSNGNENNNNNIDKDKDKEKEKEKKNPIVSGDYVSIYIDARPAALDSVNNFVDNVRMQFHTLFNNTSTNNNK